MGVKYLSDIFDIGTHVLTSVIDATTNLLLMQTGNAVTGEARADNSELWQQPGLASLPSPPTPGVGACEVITIRHSERDCVIAARDPRTAAIYGNIKAGETCLFATGVDGKAQGRVVLKQDGSVYLATKQGNVATGTDIMFGVTPRGLVFSSPAGKMFFDSAGFRVVLSAAAGGASLRLGSVPNIPLGLGSQFTVSAGATRLDSRAVFLGPSTAGYANVVSTVTPAPTPTTVVNLATLLPSGCVKIALG